MFHSGEREVQRRAGVSEAAQRVGAGVRPALTESARRFLAEQGLAVAASLDSAGAVWASPLSGPLGFIQAVDDELLRIETRYAGALLVENLLARAPLGLLVIDFVARRRLRLHGRALVDGEAIFLRLAEAYANCPKYIRPRSLVPWAAVSSPSAPVRSRSLSERQRDWVESADTFFIASVHSDAGADASHRGGDPGFVRVEPDGSLVFPDYPGNNVFNTLGNLVENPRAGLLFLDFDRGDALQLTGDASLDWSVEAVRSHPGAAKVVVRFAASGIVEVPGGGVRSQ
jgi:predicted pyridoxine 5'-phosphate oxidase superfamily flavin-nucleotide-binding protein